MVMQHLIEGSVVTRPESAPTQGGRVDLAELAAPLLDRLIGDDDAPLGQQLLDVTVAEGKLEGQQTAWAMISGGKR